MEWNLVTLRERVVIIAHADAQALVDKVLRVVLKMDRCVSIRWVLGARPNANQLERCAESDVTCSDALNNIDAASVIICASAKRRVRDALYLYSAR